MSAAARAGSVRRARGCELPVLRVALVPKPGWHRERGRAVRSPAAAARVLAPFLAEVPAARRLALALVDGRRRLLGVALVDGAGMSACCLRPAEVFAPAVVAGAAGVYLAHRHLGRQPYGRRPDFASAEQVEDVARELGMHVHDHLVFDEQGRYASLDAAREAWRAWRGLVKRTPQVVLPVWQPAGVVTTHPAARPRQARRRLAPVAARAARAVR